MSAVTAASGVPARGREGRPRARLTARAAVLLVVAGALVFAMAVPLRTYLSQRTQLVKLQQQATVLQQQNAALETQVGELHDPAYLERLARECLGMVRPGEIAFTIAPKRGSSPAPPPIGQANC
ncbi:MAG TPA: septum formation initiator family protein [Actinomycetota bacterium]|jgi:cell division protein FtsL